MRTVLTHVWKEWREQRWILLAILAAIPLLTWLGGWALGLGALVWGRFAPAYVAGATALSVLALSTELFAAEGRRDGFGFLRRTPGALRVAWGAKTAFYLLACAATCAWSALVLLCTAGAFGGDVARDEVVLALGDSLTPILTGLVVAVGLWILMASTWIPRGAAAAGATLLLLALLAAPLWLLHEAHPEFRLERDTRLAVAIGFVLVPLLASALGFLRGHRFARHPWSAAWPALALVLAVAAPAYALGARSVDRWLDLWPQQEDVYMDGVWVSPDGRFAYLNAYRPGDSRARYDGTPQQVLARPFRVDLRTGEATPMGTLGSRVDAPFDVWASGGAATRRGTVGLVLVYVPIGDGKVATTWWDAYKGVVVKTLPSDVRTPDVIELQRAEMRRITPNHLPDGRPVWILARAMEHDGEDGGVVSVPLDPGLMTSAATSGGWWGYENPRRGSPANTPARTVLVRADAEGRPVTSPWSAKNWEGQGLRLGADRHLARSTSSRGPRPWMVVTAATEEAVPALGLLPADALLATLSKDRLLVLRRDARGGTGELLVVDPVSGETKTLPMPAGAPARPGSAWVNGATPDGSMVLGLESGGTRGHVLLDAAGEALRTWTPQPSLMSDYLLACVDDDTAIFVSNLHTLLRVRWGSAEREVLFPR